MKPAALLALVVLSFSSAFASTQGPCPAPTGAATDVRFLVDGKHGTMVTLDDLKWFEGTWRGKVFGLEVEHVVLPAEGGQIPGLVRLIGDDGVVLYELSSFLVVDGKLAYRNRLFSADLSTQESATGEMMTRAGVGADGNVVFFDGITFAQLTDDCAAVSFILPNAEGQQQKNTVLYRRLP